MINFPGAEDFNTISLYVPFNKISGSLPTEIGLRASLFYSMCQNFLTAPSFLLTNVCLKQSR